MTVPTTRETADHAELARLAEAAIASGVDGQLPSTSVEVSAFASAANPARVLALLSEIAMLRGERRDIVSHATMGATNGDGLTLNGVSVEITRLRNAMHSSYHDRATQAECQRDEAVEYVARLLDAADEKVTDARARIIRSEARSFLANQGAE